MLGAQQQGESVAPGGGDSALGTDAGSATVPDAAAAAPAAPAGSGSETAATGTAATGTGTAGAAPNADAKSAGNAGAASGKSTNPRTALNCTGKEAPIKVGTVATTSGVLGYVFASAVDGIKAWVADVNSRGGVNCHKIDYVAVDDGGDPARYQALARRLVENDKVVAFIMNPAPISAQAGREYLNSKKIPVIGQEGGKMWVYDAPPGDMHFPLWSAADMMQAETVLMAAHVYLPQGKKIAGSIVCAEVEYCNVGERTYAKYAPQLGFQMAYQAKVSLTAPDFTAQCLQARNNKVDVLLTSVDGQTNHRIANSCAKIGYHPILAVAGLQSEVSYQDNPNMLGSITGMNTLPWFVSTNPAIAAYQLAIKKFVPGAEVEAASINGWTAAKGFEAAMGAIKPGDTPTTAAILAGLYGFDGENLDGLTYPLRFSPNKPFTRIACGWPVVTGKGLFTAAEKNFICIDGLKP